MTIERESQKQPGTFTNSLGMTFVRIEPGDFVMGQEDGDWDERPTHRARLTRPFALGVTPVTNAQFEEFDPLHALWRGCNGFSTRDDEAVVFVSWYEAAAFCRWLTEKERIPYRLPTEAEWEYACRAGTTTPFSTGDELPVPFHRHQQMEWIHEPVSLNVGLTPANPWGLCEMHGTVEEWCSDWYGPYDAGDQTDPVGRESGIFRVTRGGSHNTDVRFLRSANRLGALPENRNWLIGFRVAVAETPTTQPLPAPEPPRCMREVVAGRAKIASPDPDRPRFEGPIPYVLAPTDGAAPLFKHNHCPSITWCPNGDLLAVWFSCENEWGREMIILGSRLRAGCEDWEPASLFFHVPDRNLTGSSLYNDGGGTLFFVNGMEVAETWQKLAMVMRTSRDSGATWSEPTLINRWHQRRNQVIHGMFRTSEGHLIQPCDATCRGQGGTALHISCDGGRTWREQTSFGWGRFAEDGQTGGWIAGIHAGVTQLSDGRLLAFGRGNDIDERMPMSISGDLGRTWTYRASEFSPIAGGQRLVLLRLREGPLFLCSFTDSSDKAKHPDWPAVDGMAVRDAAGGERTVYGLFGALSFDEGETWPVRKLITAPGEPRRLNGGAWTREFLMDATHAEPRGYLACTQTPDGTIHLISSALHYRFNLAWLKEPMPAVE